MATHENRSSYAAEVVRLVVVTRKVTPETGNQSAMPPTSQETVRLEIHWTMAQQDLSVQALGTRLLWWSLFYHHPDFYITAML